VYDVKASSESSDTCCAPEVLSTGFGQEVGSSLILHQNSSFVVLESSESGDSDFTVLSDYEDDEEPFEEIQLNNSLNFDITFDEIQADDQLTSVLTAANEQGAEVEVLCHSVLRAHEMLQKFASYLEPLAVAQLSSEPFEELTVADEIEAAASGDENPYLSVSLSLAAQERDLDVMLESLTLQNKLLMDLLEHDRGKRETPIRTEFCKRDACCGPGSQ